jgi:hypothetical protein
MTTSDRDYDAHGDFQGLVQGLEELACHLDAEHYPGVAWPVSPGRRSRPLHWKVAAPLAMALGAAAICVVLALRIPPQPDQRAQPVQQELVRVPNTTEERVSPEPMVAQAATPQVVVVEDMESYSFIDMTTGTPMVSFATKDSCSPSGVVPVVTEPEPEPGATDKGT